MTLLRIFGALGFIAALGIPESYSFTQITTNFKTAIGYDDVLLIKHTKYKELTQAEKKACDACDAPMDKCAEAADKFSGSEFYGSHAICQKARKLCWYRAAPRKFLPDGHCRQGERCNAC